jgi:hypothetical protein
MPTGPVKSITDLSAMLTPDLTEAGFSDHAVKNLIQIL